MLHQLQQSNLTRLYFVLVVGLWFIVGFQEEYLVSRLNDLQNSLYLFMPIEGGASISYDRLVTVMYSFLYCGLSILIIHLYFKKWPVTEVAVSFYVVMVAITVILNELGKSIPFDPLRVTAYRLMTVIVSPLPIILIIPIVYFTNILHHYKRQGDI